VPGFDLELAPRDHRNPEGALSKTCPAFNQNATPTIEIAKVQYDPIANVSLELILTDAYPQGVASADPNQRYTLARFVIDQSTA
jgi:hypothetical protein